MNRILYLCLSNVLHFTPKTYIVRSIFDLSNVTYKKLVPSMSWEVIEFFIFYTMKKVQKAVLLHAQEV